MIPNAYIQGWSATAPWPDPRQIEQDLIICRALCDLFNAPALKGVIAFRGGTAIHKLLFAQPLRYSEDIDLVQTGAQAIGATVDAIRDALSWLGKCNREQAEHSMHLIYKYAPEADPRATLKLKIEINTREHDNLLGLCCVWWDLIVHLKGDAWKLTGKVLAGLRAASYPGLLEGMNPCAA